MPEFWSGILNERIYFGDAGDFTGSGRFRAGTGVGSCFVACAGSFKVNTGSGGGTFVVNGVSQGTNKDIYLTAGQLSQFPQ